MCQNLQDSVRRHPLFLEVERREEFTVALVRPAHAMIAARTEQPRVQDLAQVVIGRDEVCELALF